MKQRSRIIKKPCGFYLCRRGDTSTSKLLTHEIEVLIPAGTYDPQSISELITSGVDKSVDFTILDGAGGKGGTMIDMTYDTGLHVNIVNGKNHSYEGRTNAETTYQNDGFIVDSTGDAGLDDKNHYVGQHILRYIGASAFSIEYADGRFSFTNMHSPVFGDTAGGTYTDPSIGLVVLGTHTVYSKKFFPVGCIGGCMITDLQPRSFWNKLGFSDINIDTKLKFDDTVFQTTFGDDDTPQTKGSKKTQNREKVAFLYFLGPCFNIFTQRPRQSVGGQAPDMFGLVRQACAMA
jgi:hypothetical protein